ncbi:MAG: hypothetical protein A2428_01435 [Bdellovibrionales bacterium RIFOXYC1_FULL_54_43]|nr:MAG: hypothetical protein A2428_01435 [Bdellovibrionales bacterium RIFOXYC1_FULL_54_43]OFZ78940.1 MAG: hypothetical protein A2603_14660 [Bdellovibrionales bacterium RIFOXYD1_FULL_55_31]
MFPLIAVGALITGTVWVAASSSRSASSAKASRREQKAEPPISPQAYVVVPLEREAGEKAPRAATIADLIGKIIV